TAAARARHKNAHRLARDRRHALRTEVGREAVPTRRRIADAKCLEDLVHRRVFARNEATAGELVERVLTQGVLPELLFEEVRRELVGAVELVFLALRALLLASFGAAILFDRDPGALRERSDSFGEGGTFELHHEIDDAPGLFAAEAVEKRPI